MFDVHCHLGCLNGFPTSWWAYINLVYRLSILQFLAHIVRQSGNKTLLVFGGPIFNDSEKSIVATDIIRLCLLPHYPATHAPDWHARFYCVSSFYCPLVSPSHAFFHASREYEIWSAGLQYTYQSRVFCIWLADWWLWLLSLG